MLFIFICYGEIFRGNFVDGGLNSVINHTPSNSGLNRTPSQKLSQTVTSFLTFRDLIGEAVALLFSYFNIMRKLRFPSRSRNGSNFTI